jgi:hypothetical protein
MAIGFGKTTQTTEQYIKNFLKHELKKVDPKILQDLWYADYSDRIYEYSIEDLLAKEWQELEVDENCSAFKMEDSHKHLRPTLHAQLGYWTLSVVRNLREKDWDMTVNVWSGDRYNFHPDVIEKDITRKYGSVVYKQWQAMVMDDLDSLQTLVNEVRNRIDFVAPSIVCCERSARLCRRVGIPVKGQFAFLFPSSYSV